MSARTRGLASLPSFSKMPRPLATRMEKVTSSPRAPDAATAAAHARRSSASSALDFAMAAPRVELLLPRWSGPGLAADLREGGHARDAVEGGTGWWWGRDGGVASARLRGKDGDGGEED